MTQQPYNKIIIKRKVKRNISRIVVDIRHPGSHGCVGPFSYEEDATKDDFLKQTPFIASRRFWTLRKVFSFVVFFLFSVVLIGGLYVWTSKDVVLGSAHSLYGHFRELSENLTALDTEKADRSLASVGAELSILEDKLRFLEFIPTLKAVPEMFENIGNLIRIIGLLNNDLALLKKEGMHMLFNDTDGQLIATLKRVDANLGDLELVGSDIRNKIVQFSSFSDIGISDNYLAISAELLEARRSLQAFIAFLEKYTDKHILVLLENSSEIRPGGGFIGSYAVVTIQKDHVTNIEVNDIYYPDYFFERNIEPPKQLQGITSDWGARDANWFFDFPTSAKKITEFMESSPVFADKRITFDAVVAVNVWTVEDLLDIVGPIEVPDYEMTLTSENFLSEIQQEVEMGRDKKPGQNPKKILSVIAPLLMEKLTQLDSGEKQRLFEIFTYRLKNKDMKFYFKDNTLEQFVQRFDAGGEVLKLPVAFSGDYLAVVNTNVAGGKTDKMINEDIALHSTVFDDGTVQDDLVVTRTHTGANAQALWYRADNQNFIKIFTHPYSHLEMLEGNTEKTVAPYVDYKAKGYEVDSDLAAVESTKVYLDEFKTSRYVESGKNVYATWFTVSAGESRELRMRYTIPQPLSVESGNTFQFIYEKQSGVEANFEYTIKAPAGFVWKENGEKIYRYMNRYLPARLILTLTLDRL
ncbi:MAG: DUF4012 domain-containing protein [bacterium]